MKLYLRINSHSDCLLLQADAYRLVAWDKSHGLSLNLKIWVVMNFFRLKSPTSFQFSINGLPITLAGNSILDLVFILTKNVCALLDIEVACCKALKLLVFVNRIYRDFHFLALLKSLYCSLIRTIAEYGSVLWNPNTSLANDMVKKVQRKFFRMVAFRLNIACPPHDYTTIQTVLILSSLADRRHLVNLQFLTKLLTNQIDSPSLLSIINLHVPSRHTRSSIPFHIPSLPSNFLLNDLIFLVLSFCPSSSFRKYRSSFSILN